MFNTEPEWIAFVKILRTTSLGVNDLAAQLRIPVGTVAAYRDMLLGVENDFSDIPETKRGFVVGFRYRDKERWIETEDIANAKARYDAGTHEMAQGRYLVNGQDAWVLFSIPRKYSTKRLRAWFA